MKKNCKPAVLRGARQVGCITYLYLEPMSFLEFVLASGNEPLFKKLSYIKTEEKIPLSLHEKCLALYSDYGLIGGMPEVVNGWMEKRNHTSCIKLQQDL